MTDHGGGMVLIQHLRRRTKELEQRLGNLLALIHGDGGQYIQQHGWSKAEADAVLVWVGLKTRIEALEAALSRCLDLAADCSNADVSMAMESGAPGPYGSILPAPKPFVEKAKKAWDALERNVNDALTCPRRFAELEALADQLRKDALDAISQKAAAEVARDIALAALTTERARLDWVLRHPWAVVKASTFQKGLFAVFKGSTRLTDWSGSERAAIDAARERE